MLATRMMQCKIRDKVEVKQQERVEEEIKCFRYQKVEHCK